MNNYLSSASLKSLAKGQLLGKYGTVIGANIIHMICVLTATFSAFLLIDTSSVLGNIIYYMAAFIIGLLSGLFLYGEAYIYLKIACHQQVTVNDLFYGFKEPNKILKVQAVLTIISMICSLPNVLMPFFYRNPDNAYLFLAITIFMLITGILNVILTLMFSQVFYLMLDFPEYDAREILLLSKKIMRGSKGRLFYIELSFLPLILLSCCTCCITFFWLQPYMLATKANFYLDLMKKSR